MKTIHLVDPELRVLLDASHTGSIDLEQLEQVRKASKATEKTAKNRAVSTEDVVLEECYIPALTDAPDIRVLIYRPDAIKAPMAALLHIHGGGMIMGAPEANDARNRDIVSRMACLLVSVDYRLAPETCHPGPIEDCYAVLSWLHGNAEVLGINAANLSLLGESAGGGLAAALGILARDLGDITIRHQFLIYPMLDDRTSVNPDSNRYAGEFIWTKNSNRFAWSCLLGHEPGITDVSPYASPARVQTYSNLPATFISVGALDLFAEENMEYARQLIRSGIPTELHVYPGAFHGFDLVKEGSALAQQSYRDLMAAMMLVLNP